MCDCRPRGAGDAEWELGGEGPADEGIQPDIIQTRLSYTSHASAVDNSLGTLNLGGVVTGTGGSLQDVRNALNGETTSTSRKTSSVSNLRIPSAGRYCYIKKKKILCILIVHSRSYP